MKILLCISSLGAGGAERVAVTMANFWTSSTSNDVTIVTLSPSAMLPFYEIDPAVTIVNFDGELAKLTGLRAVKARICYIRKSFVRIRPDVIISFIDQLNVYCLAAAAFTGIPVIVTEHIDIAYHDIGALWNFLRNIFYPMAIAVVCVSKGVLSSMPVHLRKKCFVIYNPINTNSKRYAYDKPHDSNARKVVMSMGRLVRQKGFDMLIRSFGLLADKHPDWDLAIYGDGTDREKLNLLVGSCGLASRITIYGTTHSPDAVMSNADLFVLSSRYEGFGLVLCEAMSYGLPVISFDCPSGPREIVTHEFNGLLVPPENVHALAESMNLLMGDEKHRNKLAKNAVLISQKFGIGVIMNQWDQFIKQLIHSN